MTDIIDKLRVLGTGYVGTTRGHRATLMNEAADVIEALRTENERLQTALHVIRTWANMDTKHPEYEPCLVAEHVVETCDKALDRD